MKKIEAPNTQPLTKEQIRNFDLLVKAIKEGDICLMSAVRKSDRTPVAVMCAVNYPIATNDDYELIPLAVMIDGNVNDQYEPPTTDVLTSEDE
jgi:rRNA-processing protein FCF1